MTGEQGASGGSDPDPSGAARHLPFARGGRGETDRLQTILNEYFPGIVAQVRSGFQILDEPEMPY